MTSTEFIDGLVASMRRGVEENRERLDDVQLPSSHREQDEIRDPEQSQ